MLFDHRCLVHDDALELAITQLLSACFANRSNDDWRALEDFLFFNFLFLEKLFELVAIKLLDSIDVAPEDRLELAHHCLYLLSDVESLFLLNSPV